MFVLETGHVWHATGLYLIVSTANSSSKLHCSGSKCHVPEEDSRVLSDLCTGHEISQTSMPWNSSEHTEPY